jgi:hypothetical protein
MEIRSPLPLSMANFSIITLELRGVAAREQAFADAGGRG